MKALNEIHDAVGAALTAAGASADEVNRLHGGLTKELRSKIMLVGDEQAMWRPALEFHVKSKLQELRQRQAAAVPSGFE